MAGLITNVVATIRNLLGDNYYPPQSIFKEFIQNADDARATHLHLGWISDWEDNPHPLLQGPVLIALNDGPFSKKDEKSIRHLGLSAKGNEAGSIGRFGFGMKSIFHFCEAFFYAVSDNQEARNGKFFVELLNPWKDSGSHDDWESIKIPEQMIKERLSFWVDEYEKWFCVLIPLRNEEQLKSKKPIKPNFRTIDELFINIQEQEMFQLSPLLKSLREVTTWGWNSNKLRPEMKNKINLPSKDLLPTRFPNIAALNTRLPVKASAIGSSLVNSRNFEKRFFGYEILLDDPRFREIKQNKAWPTKENAATSEDEPEKGEPHCAAIFSVNESKSGDLGKLIIQRAVFLPLTKPEETINCRGNLDFSLLLHGYYFLDSARVSPLKPTESEKDRPDLVWNNKIDQLGVYPLILPSLHKFVEETHLPATDVNRLTDAIQKSEFFRDNKDCICAQSHWLSQVCDQSKGNGKWGLFETTREYFVLPAPPTNCPELPFQLFPNLSKASLENIFVFDGQPKLTKNNPGKWNAALIKQLVSILNIECLTSQDGMDYLFNFVERSFGKLELEDQKACSTTVVHSLMLLVRDHNPSAVIKRHERFFNLLKILGRVSIVTLDCTWEIVEKLIKFIPDNELNQFLFPKAMLPKEVESGKLSLSVADTILRKLGRGHDQSVDPLAMTRTALAVIEATDGGRQDLLGKTGDYKLFGLDELGTTKKRIVSWRELADLFEKKQLIEKGYSASANFADHLQKAIPELKFYTLNKKGNIEPFKLLFDCPAPHFNEDFCIEILNSRPKLASSQDRIDLLKKLINEFSETFGLDYLRAVRYLLHGNTQHHDDTNTYLLFHTNAEDDNFCSRLTQEALKRCQDKWFVIDPALGNEINQNQGSRLKVKVLTSNLEEGLLGKMTDLSWINELAPTQDDYNKILKDLENQELFRTLPIHLDVHGNRVSIGSHPAYLRRSDFSASKELENLVTVVEAPKDRKAVLDYQKFLELWTPETALKSALESDNPSVWWRDILDCLQKIDPSYLTQTSDELTRLYRVTSWIPTQYGPKPPEDLILLEASEDKLRFIFDKLRSEGIVVDIGGIDNDFRSHPAFRKVIHYLVPKPDDVMKLLGNSLSKFKDFWIGEVYQENRSDFLGKFVLVFGPASTNLLPTVSILKWLLDQKHVEEDVCEHFIEPLAQPISKQKIITLLEFISKRHEEAKSNEKKSVFEVFNWYLSELIKFPDFSVQDLSKIRLLNENGNWQSPEKLCMSMEGINSSHLLERNLADILKSVVCINSGTQMVHSAHQNERSMGSKELRDYFMQFEGYISRKNIGALLCFMGNSQAITALAEEYLGHNNFRLIRDRIKIVSRPEEKYTVYPSDSQFLLNTRIFDFYQVLGDSRYTVMNLTGGWFEANLSKSYKNIFVSRPDKNIKISSIGIRNIHRDTLNRSYVSNLLLESARYLLNCRCLGPQNLDEFWESWRKAEQLDLSVAQDLIVENAMLYFRQLGGKYLPEINDLLDSWRKLQNQAAEIRNELRETEAKKQLETVEEQKRNVMFQLRRRIETDPNAQDQLLLAVRQKIGGEFQYNVESIPFEIFQNADDASMELRDMVGSNAHHSINGFDLIWNDFQLVFVHSGRAINQYTKGSFSSQRGKELKYHQDLENMLLLSCSDKGSIHRQVTGKFGLGFKSVFLVSRNPKVLSGALGFEVVGGLYPKQLNSEDRKRLSRILADQSGNRDGTIFEVGFEKEFGRVPEDIVQRFIKMLPFTLVFSRQIKRACLKGPKHPQPVRLHWEDKQIGNCHHAFIGRLLYPISEQMLDSSAIVLRKPSSADHSFGALLIGIGPTGVQPLPELVPTFWNLCPVGRMNSLGIAVNGNFEVDVGRAQLAESPERHLGVAGELGQTFGVALKELHSSSEADWDKLRSDLDLAGDTTHYQFWESVWKLIGLSMASEDFGKTLEEKLCKEIFWKDGSGLMGLFKRSKALPSGLHGDYARLTKLGDIKWYVRGVLDTDPQIFTEISKWKSFRQHFPFGSGELVSESRIRIPLKNLVARDFDWEHVDIVIAIKCELGESGYVSPESAERLGRTINRRFLKQLKANEQEHEYLAEYLGKLKFWSLAGNLVSCKKLLILHESNVEESMKAAFAPEDSVLDPEYGLNAIEFFNACRLRMNEDINLMTEWGLKASSHEQKTAFLKYLVDGASGPKIRDLILDKKAGSWLDNVEEERAFQDLEANCRQKILRSVADLNNISDGFNWGSPDLQTPQLPDSAHDRYVSRRSPSDVLSDIYEWWEKQRDNRLADYEQMIYPRGEFLLRDVKSCSDEDRKKKWLKMFLLACLQTIGRVRHDAKKQFLENSNLLISDLVGFENNPNDWLRSFDQLIERQIHDFKYYDFYLRLFGVYIVGRRLTDYIELIEKVDDHPPGKPIYMTQILIPRISGNLQFGGVDAPPISRVLGIGAHFLFRELRRNGILTHLGLNQLCYVPNERLIGLLGHLGCQGINEKETKHEKSRTIANFLEEKLGKERALFKNDFDIPLQVIAYDSKLQTEFLGYPLPTNADSL